MSATINVIIYNMLFSHFVVSESTLATCQMYCHKHTERGAVKFKPDQL